MRTLIALFLLTAFVVDAAPPITRAGANTNDEATVGFWAQRNNASNAVVGINANHGASRWDPHLLPEISRIMYGALVATNEMHLDFSSPVTNSPATNVGFVTIYAQNTGVACPIVVDLKLLGASGVVPGAIITVTREDLTTNSVRIIDSSGYYLGGAFPDYNLFPYGLTNGESITLQQSSWDGTWHIIADARATNGFVTSPQLNSATNVLAQSTTNLVNGATNTLAQSTTNLVNSATNTLAQSISNAFVLLTQLQAAEAAITNAIIGATNTASIVRTNSGYIPAISAAGSVSSNAVQVITNADSSITVTHAGNVISLAATGGGGGGSVGTLDTTNALDITTAVNAVVYDDGSGNRWWTNSYGRTIILYARVSQDDATSPSYFFLLKKKSSDGTTVDLNDSVSYKIPPASDGTTQGQIRLTLILGAGDAIQIPLDVANLGGSSFVKDELFIH
jgi:hypothetical protein